MKVKEVLKSTMTEEKVTQTEMSKAMGLKSQQAVGNLLSRGDNMHTDTFIKMLNIMGYEVIVRKKKQVGEVSEVEVEV